MRRINVASKPLYLVSKETFEEVVEREGSVNKVHVGFAKEKFDEVPVLKVGIKPHPGL